GAAGVGTRGSTARVPPLPWRDAWIALGAVACAGTLATWGVARASRDVLQTGPDASASHRTGVRWMPMAMLLIAYLQFGFGYIGYMTFIVTLLREQGIAPGWVDAFYGLLGAGVVGSSGVWAGVLQRFRGGEALALLCGMLTLATL